MRESIIRQIEEKKIIAIIRGLDIEKMIDTVRALQMGGIRFAEVTFDSTEKTSPEKTAEAIRVLDRTFQGAVQIGAGTVLTPRQVELAYSAGARYIISPNVDPEVIGETRRLGLISIPGALTPTEAVTARDAGADFVKLFPAGDLGVGYVKALMAPLKHIPFLAVGGVDTENIRDFMAIGVRGFGIGSNIVRQSLIEKGNYEGITVLAKEYMRKLERGD